ncbi:MAG TPA: isoprenylcysteine carboxylmethyltransferase family protein [Rhodothermales bacterium]|nr:isoprenylcysteine carboxylmethyltransferase family protein [Rhodothermales bacterium]
MSRVIAFFYGAVSYVVFLGAFLYAIGFTGNLVVPKSIDSGVEGPFAASLLIDVLLLGLFALQHSGMARPGFKRQWTKLVPEPIERSTYVLLASLALILLYRFWQPLPDTFWTVENATGRAVLWTLFGIGWGLVLTATFMISHAHLFGMKQVYQHLRRQEAQSPGFKTPGLYRYMRHPIMAGFFIAFWATPDMSMGHLLFALATTGYILIALQLEEHDLVQMFGERYREYRRQVRMFVPLPKRSGRQAREHA